MNYSIKLLVFTGIVVSMYGGGVVCMESGHDFCGFPLSKEGEAMKNNHKAEWIVDHGKLSWKDCIRADLTEEQKARIGNLCLKISEHESKIANLVPFFKALKSSQRANYTPDQLDKAEKAAKNMLSVQEVLSRVVTDSELHERGISRDTDCYSRTVRMAELALGRQNAYNLRMQWTMSVWLEEKNEDTAKFTEAFDAFCKKLEVIENALGQLATEFDTLIEILG